MVTHHALWRAIDQLAASHGLSVSGLARKAGLDPTTFNPSKRASKDGRNPRWPTTRSLVLALNAVGADFSTLAHLIQQQTTAGD